MEIVDRINDRVGQAVSWLVPLLILELVYDTVARYVFNSPTEWSYDVSYMLYGTIFMLGAAHTLRTGRHVRIETIYGKLSPRSRAVIDIVGYLIFFFPAVGACVYFGGIFALKSWEILEMGGDSMWQPPIYPFKTILPIAAALLMLQGTVECIRCVLVVAGREDVCGKP